MNTLGYLFILISILVIRQVFKGRVMNIGEDLTDTFVAFTTGDTDALAGILARTGDSATADKAEAAAGFGNNTPVPPNPNSGLVAAAQRRGQAAKGYRWTATGPDYYDCSGLMWRACQDIGYKGPRFTTADVRQRKGFTVVAVGVPGDIVLWPAGSGGPTGHMGVMTGADQFYSARSVRSGIGTSKISTFRKTKPLYVRFTPPAGK